MNRMSSKYRLISFFTIVLGICTALAISPGSAWGSEANRFGEVMAVRGGISIMPGGSGKAVKLEKGNIVYVGDKITASSTGEAIIKTEDDGYVGVRPSSVFVAESMVANGDSSDNFAVRLFKGSLRLISGWVDHTNPAGSQVHTDTVTIGIRGTDHEPYVLSEEDAARSQYGAGVYDKVNQGKTTLGVGQGLLEVGAGQVGYQRALSSNLRSRSLMTILMPVLLDKVPSFYVTGKLDAELDKLSAGAQADSLKQLELKRKGGKHACAPHDIAVQWLGTFDRYVMDRNADAVIDLFAPEIKVHVTVLDENGKPTSVDISRDEMIKSAIQSMNELKKYQQKRLSIDSQEVKDHGISLCNRITVQSHVVESGVLGTRPYRVESEESYLLELRNGKWLAVKAASQQK